LIVLACSDILAAPPFGVPSKSISLGLNPSTFAAADYCCSPSEPTGVATLFVAEPE
jgi:hypothetical protein